MQGAVKKLRSIPPIWKRIPQFILDMLLLATVAVDIVALALESTFLTPVQLSLKLYHVFALTAILIFALHLCRARRFALGTRFVCFNSLILHIVVHFAHRLLGWPIRGTVMLMISSAVACGVMLIYIFLRTDMSPHTGQKRFRLFENLVLFGATANTVLCGIGLFLNLFGVIPSSFLLLCLFAFPVFIAASAIPLASRPWLISIVVAVAAVFSFVATFTLSLRLLFGVRGTSVIEIIANFLGSAGSIQIVDTIYMWFLIISCSIQALQAGAATLLALRYSFIVTPVLKK